LWVGRGDRKNEEYARSMGEKRVGGRKEGDQWVRRRGQ
jgi:hypothetical protein